jgi:hypothetical protein
MSTFNKFLIYSIIMFFTLNLAISSSFQNNNLPQNFIIIKDHFLQIVYAEHTNKDNDDDDDDYDLDEICKDNYDNDNGKDDDDDDYDLDEICKDYDDDSFKLNFPDDSYFDFTNPRDLSEEEVEDLLSSSSSLEDYYDALKDYYSYLERTNPSLSLKDKEKIEKLFSEVEDSSNTIRDRFSALVDLSNPPPFSEFQDPIPKQPGQPLHPDLPSIPTLPPEATEPRNPPIPPP